MIIVELTTTYHHTARRTWHPGDRPVVSRDLAVKMLMDQVAIYIGEGCGCPNQADK